MNAKHFTAPEKQPRGSAVFEAENIVVERSGRRLLDGVSIELRAGEILALLGPNGAGKSTLMGALSGDVQPDSGEVRFVGTPLHNWDPTHPSLGRRALLPANQGP